MRRRRRNPSLGDVNTLLMWGAIAVGAYVVYKIVTGAGAVAKKIGDVQQTAGSAVADLFPNYIAPPGGQFTVTMPDGSTQVVNTGGRPVANPNDAPYDTSILPDFSAGNF